MEAGESMKSKVVRAIYQVPKMLIVANYAWANTKCLYCVRMNWCVMIQLMPSSAMESYLNYPMGSGPVYHMVKAFFSFVSYTNSCFLCSLMIIILFWWKLFMYTDTRSICWLILYYAFTQVNAYIKHFFFRMLSFRFSFLCGAVRILRSFVIRLYRALIIHRINCATLSLFHTQNAHILFNSNAYFLLFSLETESNSRR